MTRTPGRCRHENVDHLFKGDIIDSDFCGEPFMAMCEQLRCIDCGTWLPLGESNDADPRVQIERRAAELAASFARGVGLGGHRPDHCTGEHCWHWFENDYDDKAGPCCYCGHDGIVLPGVENNCQAGYLARCIVEHDDKETK